MPRAKSEGLRQYQRNRFPFQAHNAELTLNRGVIDIPPRSITSPAAHGKLMPVFAVPAYGPQNDVTLKMPAFEWVHVQLHQQRG